MNRDFCCHSDCSQGRAACPLVEAKKRGFVEPVIQKKPEPPESPSHWFGIAVVLALIAFVILVDPLFRFDLPFVGK